MRPKGLKLFRLLEKNFWRMEWKYCISNLARLKKHGPYSMSLQLHISSQNR